METAVSARPNHSRWRAIQRCRGPPFPLRSPMNWCCLWCLGVPSGALNLRRPRSVASAGRSSASLLFSAVNRRNGNRRRQACLELVIQRFSGASRRSSAALGAPDPTRRPVRLCHRARPPRRRADQHRRRCTPAARVSRRLGDAARGTGASSRTTCGPATSKGFRHRASTPGVFPNAASLLPGLLAATRTGLPPASDDELTNEDQPPSWSTSTLRGARNSSVRLSSPVTAEYFGVLGCRRSAQRGVRSM